MTIRPSDPSDRRLQAVEDNLLGHVSYLQERLPGMRVSRHPDVVIVDSGLDSDTFNKVLAARLSPESAEERIDQVLAEVRGTGRPFCWWIGPCSRPASLAERLHRRGLREEDREVGMVLDLARLPERVPVPEGATIQAVDYPAQLADFAGVLAGLAEPQDEKVRAFFERAEPLLLDPQSPMRLFIAYLGDQPAAVGELFLGGGVAGVHMVATAAEHRRRGLGMAITWTLLAEGRRRGLELGALQASAAGRPVCERLGFEACGELVELAIG